MSRREREREQRLRYVVDLDQLDRRLALPPHMLDRSGRLPPPLDLEPGFHTICCGCAAAPVNRRCADCPRTTRRMWRNLTAPPEPFRLFRRRRKD